MLKFAQSTLQNRLLRILPPEQFAAIEQDLQPVSLPHKHDICVAGQAFDWVVFPETGLVSIVADSTGRQLEVGIVGRDGLAPYAAVLGSDTSPLRQYVQVEGQGHRMRATALHAAIDASPPLRALLLRYVHAFTMQASQTALANGTCTIEQRLARWLLMVQDRVDGDEVRLTHEFLSYMLGVRRTGVTLALHVLEGEGLIRARRGSITIVDRARLIVASNNSYGPAEAEYERLLGGEVIGAG